MILDKKFSSCSERSTTRWHAAEISQRRSAFSSFRFKSSSKIQLIFHSLQQAPQGSNVELSETWIFCESLARRQERTSETLIVINQLSNTVKMHMPPEIYRTLPSNINVRHVEDIKSFGPKFSTNFPASCCSYRSLILKSDKWKNHNLLKTAVKVEFSTSSPEEVERLWRNLMKARGGHAFPLKTIADQSFFYIIMIKFQFPREGKRTRA